MFYYSRALLAGSYVLFVEVLPQPELNYGLVVPWIVRIAPHRVALHRTKPQRTALQRTALHCTALSPTHDAVLRANLFLDSTLIIFYAIASIVSIIAMAIKVRVFMQQLRERRNELSALDEGTLTARQEKLQKHRKRLVKTTRTIHMTYTSMMLGVAECIPIGILQGVPIMHCVYVCIVPMHAC